MAASFIPQYCSNHRKSVLPAVCAKGRFNVGSRGPGACPIIITLLTIAPPETGVDCMRGQRLHCRSIRTCLSSCFLAVAIPTALWGATSEDPGATEFEFNLEAQRRNIENSERSRLNTMLRTMQVTIGK